MPTLDVVAYSAGFFDGEGSAFYSVDGRTGDCFGAVALTQVDRSVLDWIASEWGFGKVYMSRRKGGTGVVHQWRVSGPNAALFLRAIRPHLHVKGERVDAWLVISAMQIGRGTRHRADGTFAEGYTAAEREALAMAVLEFRRGVRRLGRRGHAA